MYSSNYQDSNIRCIDELNIEELPSGRTTRVLVSLVHDGIGRATRAPVIVIKGNRSGPVFGVVAALHGNELNGIPVIHKLVETISASSVRGAIVAMPALNIAGLIRREREFRDGTDLNHIMPGIPDGNEPNAYAHRLTSRLMGCLDYLADLHTASFGRINTLYVRADLTDRTTARMAMLQRPTIILHNTPADHTLRGWFSSGSKPAITVEIGDPHVFQPQKIRRTLSGLRALFSQMKMLPKRALKPVPPPMLCSRSKWLYTDRGGLLQVLPELAQLVEPGELIARQVDIFGDLVREYRAPYRGVIIGKSIDPVSPTGSRIIHLGQLAEPGQFPHAEDAPKP